MNKCRYNFLGEKMLRKQVSWVVICFFVVFSTKLDAKIYSTFAPIAEKAIPGVVNIRTKKVMERKPGIDLYEFFMDDTLLKERTSTSLGSGIIIGSKGHIVTNYHVIKGADKIKVLFAHTKELAEAHIIGVDPKTDLALLKTSLPKKIEVLTWGDSNKLRVGDVVLAIGNPFGYSHTVTSGIISAKGRVLGTGPYDDFLQTDATIHPGNSGGPLLDLRGRVIGVNTAISRKGGAGIGFAIPAELVQKILKDLIKFGKVKRPWIGMVGKNILSRQELDSKVSSATSVYGVLVQNLIVDGPAHKSGLKIGDLIMEVNGQKIYDLSKLQRLIINYKSTDKLKIKLYRSGKGFIERALLLQNSPAVKDLPQSIEIF